MTNPLVKHDDEHSVPNHPLLTYTHEQGTRRVVDRASGIDIRILLQWLHDGELPPDITRESVEACVLYQSEIDAAEVLLAWRTCTLGYEIVGASSLAKFRLLPVADRQLLARVFSWKPYGDRAITSRDDYPKACECDAPVLLDCSRGVRGMVKCTRCHHEWCPDGGLHEENKMEWRRTPTFADNLDAIR